MASSNASPLGECVVCGKETSTRCADCSKNGTPWMFFCSRKHQKLIWSTHKRVCGKRSSPFRWPGFSEKELDRMMETAELPMVFASEAEPLSILDGLLRAMQRNGGPRIPTDIEARKKMLRSLLEKYKERDGDETFSEQRLRGIAGYRKMWYTAVGWSTENKDTQSQQAAGYAALKDNVFNYLVGLEEQLVDDSLPMSPAQYEPWWGTFQHKYLINLSIVQQLLKAENLSADLALAARYTSQEMQRFLTEVVSPAHPLIARLFLPIVGARQ